jgi:hypothetical protein
MTFKASALQRVETAGSWGAGSEKVFARFDYVIEDAAAVVEAANYFNAAKNTLKKGDVITAVMDVNGATPKLKQYIVTSNNGTTVVIALQSTAAG